MHLIVFVQMMRIENLYRLRDSIGRQEDEGVQYVVKHILCLLNWAQLFTVDRRYVLPKMLLLKIALGDPPSNIAELLSRCTEWQAPLVEKYATDIIATLRQDHCPVRPPKRFPQPRRIHSDRNRKRR